MNEHSKKNRREVVQEISLVAFCTHLAFVLAIPVVAGAFIGWWLDRTFATDIIFVVIGTICGIIIATVITVRKVTALIAQADQDYEELKNLKDNGGDR